MSQIELKQGDTVRVRLNFFQRFTARVIGMLPNDIVVVEDDRRGLHPSILRVRRERVRKLSGR